MLAKQDDSLTAEICPPDEPIVVIFSLPRGASTLFQQLAISSLNIGYVSNLVARFWRAPYVATLLSCDLADPEYVSNFKSNYGNVVGAQEPHEWGWFWRHWLGLSGDETYCRDDVDFNSRGLAEKIGAVQSVWQAPFLIDSIYAIANYKRLSQILPRLVAVHVKRDTYYVCNSHINARLQRHGDVNQFYGHRPKNINEIIAIANPIEQIVAQVFAAQQEIESTLFELSSENVLTVEYNDLISQPQNMMKQLHAFLGKTGSTSIERRDLPKLNLEFRDNPKFINKEFREELDLYYAQYFEN